MLNIVFLNLDKDSDEDSNLHRYIDSSIIPNEQWSTIDIAEIKIFKTLIKWV